MHLGQRFINTMTHCQPQTLILGDVYNYQKWHTGRLGALHSASTPSNKYRTGWSWFSDNGGSVRSTKEHLYGYLCGFFQALVAIFLTAIFGSTYKGNMLLVGMFLIAFLGLIVISRGYSVYLCRWMERSFDHNLTTGRRNTSPVANSVDNCSLQTQRTKTIQDSEQNKREAGDRSVVVSGTPSSSCSIRPFTARRLAPRTLRNSWTSAVILEVFAAMERVAFWNSCVRDC